MARSPSPRCLTIAGLPPTIAHLFLGPEQVEELNLIVVCGAAFAAVVVLLSLLAGLMYLLAALFPAESEKRAAKGVEEKSSRDAPSPASERVAVASAAPAKSASEARERTAAITAVLLALEEEEGREVASSSPDSFGGGWKMMGRLERFDDSSTVKKWKRVS